MVALIINRTISTLLPYRLRPMFTPDIGIRHPLWENTVADYANWSSFPSDHAAYFFAMATCFWFVSKRLGFLLVLFSAWIMLPRVYLGFHYPSDLLIGALIGIGVALVLNREQIRALLASPVMVIEQRAPVYFAGFLFIIVFEFCNMFTELRQIGNGIFHVLEHFG